MICRSKGTITSKSAYDLLFAILLCVPCTLLCVLLSQNEIYLDDWYIEASANGFFGEDNRSLWVLGANIILTGLIYLLSLTGIRLFWLHIILVGVNFISHVMITLVLIRNIGKVYGTVVSVLFGLLMGPLAFFEFQFTTTAAYGIAAGCVFMLDAVKQRRKGEVFFSALWIILSSGVRFDAIYYSMAYMGSFWLFQNLPEILRCKNGKKWNGRLVWSIIKERLLPFAVTLVICFGIELAYLAAMDIAVPGFREYNSIRTQVDDCEMPDYETYREEYEKIGLSQNDYNLMLAWNNMDAEFFTQERLEGVLEIAQKAEKDQEASETEKTSFLKNIWYSASRYPAMWILGICFTAAFIVSNGIMTGCCIALLGVTLVFYSYFLSIGRLIWRTEWPIWIAINCTLVLLLCELDIKSWDHKKGKNRIVAVLLVCIMLFCPYYGADSMYTKYKSRVHDPDSVLVYLYERLVNKHTLCYETYCRYAAYEIVEDKENYYFALGSPGYWLQQYPMPAVDTFRFSEINAGENWGALGQYFAILPQVTRAYNKYGIENPFRDLVNKNVRVTGRAEESYHRMKEVYIYLQEHYYKDVSFGVEKILHNDEAVVCRFINGRPGKKVTAVKGKMDVTYGGFTGVPGMVYIYMDTTNIPLYDSSCDDAYVCLKDRYGKEHVYSLYDLDSTVVITFYDNLQPGQEYTVDFLFEHEDKWYCAEKCSILHVPSV